jgi:hypothetical protein
MLVFMSLENPMQRAFVTAMLIVAASAAALADVRIEEKTQMKFGGAMGRVVNLFAGRAAREGVISTVAVKGDRKATRTENNGQIIDLREEKIYDVDYKDRSYKVTTFAEVRRQMEEARKKAADAARDPGTAPAAPRDPSDDEPQVDIDFNLKESGQRREINGFNAREVVMTVAVREKGKKLEESGGLVLTSNIWLTPAISGTDEVGAFDLRYAKQLGMSAMLDAQQMAAMTAMYPMMKQAMERFEAENVKMDGTAVLTVVSVEAVANAEQAAEQAKAAQPQPQQPPTGLGGLGGALGGRLGRRVLGGNQNNADAAPSSPGRATVMTTTHEVVKVTPSVADADIAIPAGFKLKS